jgi:dTMP kinase
VPDLTLILDLRPKWGFGAPVQRANGAMPDRFEKEALATTEKRREGFAELAERDPERCRLVDAGRAEMEVAAEIAQLVETLLAERRDHDEDPAAPRAGQVR